MPGCKQCCYSTGTMQGRRGMVCFRTADRYMFVPSVARQNVYNFLRTCPGFAIDFEWPLGFYVYAGIACYLSLSRFFLYTLIRVPLIFFLSVKYMLSGAELLLTETFSSTKNIQHLKRLWHFEDHLNEN